MLELCSRDRSNNVCVSIWCMSCGRRWGGEVHYGLFRPAPRTSSNPRKRPVRPGPTVGWRSYVPRVFFVWRPGRSNRSVLSIQDIGLLSIWIAEPKLSHSADTVHILLMWQLQLPGQHQSPPPDPSAETYPFLCNYSPLPARSRWAQRWAHASSCRRCDRTLKKIPEADVAS